MRGAARLSAKDYRGALDDFRVAQRLGVAPGAAEAIADTIVKLEAYVAAEDAAALNAPKASESSEPPPAAQPAPEQD